MAHPLYRLYDVIDISGELLHLGDFETLSMARAYARIWDIEETDGECCIIAYKWSEKDGKWFRDKNFKY